MSFTSPWQSPLYVRTVALLRALARPFPGLEDRLIAVVTERQNRRVRAHLATHPCRSLLLIMPRCVKKPGCPADVQNSLSRCVDCTECPLGDVARLCRHHDIEALVAFRSHIAFDMARTRRPDLIIATACSDRLIKALRSVPEIPALLTPLAGMERMCVGARVDLPWLKEQLNLVAPVQAGPPAVRAGES